MPRSRSQTFLGPAYKEGRSYRDYPDSTPDYVTWEGQTLHAHGTETMTDEVTSGFHRQAAEGAVVINPCTHVKESTRTLGEGIMEYKRLYHPWSQVYDVKCLTQYFWDKSQPKFQAEPDLGDPTYDLVSASKLQALGSIDRSPYAFAEDIAEMRETLRFLKNPLKALDDLSKEFSDFASTLLKKDRNLKRVDAISNAWLQYQFAFSPLVRSASDLLEALNDNKKLPNRRTARGKAEYLAGPSTNEGIISYWHTMVSKQIETKVYAGVLYEVTNPVNGWRDKYGLRFKDIPETLWAIFPYSFMVDRIFNLSQAVRGFVSFLDPNVKILGAWTSDKTTTHTYRSYLNYTNTGVVESMTRMVPDVVHVENVTYNREVWEPSINDLIPELRLKDLVDSSTKIADLAALVWQRIGGRFI